MSLTSKASPSLRPCLLEAEMAKQTDSKVPQIRFKEFDGTWEEMKLGALCAIGDTDHWMPETTSQGIPYVMTGDFCGVNEIDFENAKLISETDYEKLSRKVKPELGDILFARYASVGAVRLVRTSRRFIVSYSCAILKNNSSFSSQYLFYLLQSGNSQSQLKQSINTGSQGNVGIESLKQFVAIFPDKTEQTQIGEYFRELDSLIGLHQRKHDKLLTLKKAMLQKMFPQPGASTPEIRFKGFTGAWVEKTLAEISEIKTGPFGSALHAKDYVADGVPIITTEHFKAWRLPKTKRGLPQVSTIDYMRLKNYVLKHGDIVFSRVGSIDINAHVEERQHGWLFSGRVLRVRIPISIDSEYLHHELSTVRVRKCVTERAVGQTMPSINTGILGATVVFIPETKAEQAKIGTYFRKLDVLISQHATQLQKLQQIKSACLEKMFF